MLRMNVWSDRTLNRFAQFDDRPNEPCRCRALGGTYAIGPDATNRGHRGLIEGRRGVEQRQAIALRRRGVAGAPGFAVVGGAGDVPLLREAALRFVNRGVADVVRVSTTRRIYTGG